MYQARFHALTIYLHLLPNLLPNLLYVTDRSVMVSEVNRGEKHVKSKENRVASEVIRRLSRQAVDLTSLIMARFILNILRYQRHYAYSMDQIN